LNGPEFDWDKANIAHIAAHGVLPQEAEEVIANNPLDLSYEMQDGEPRFRQVGETSSGRVLLVVSTERRGVTRVITAHRPSRFLHDTYLKSRKESTIDAEENPS
jgi:hypothetical protein